MDMFAEVMGKPLPTEYFAADPKFIEMADEVVE